MSFPRSALLAFLLAVSGLWSAPTLGDRYAITPQTVIDRDTGLMWMRCVVGQHFSAQSGQCEGQMVSLSWPDARQLRVEVGGYDDWRLPTDRELRSLVYCSSGDPVAIGMTRPYTACQGSYDRPTLWPDAFGSLPTWGVWSGSEHSGYPGTVWYLYLYNGFIGHYNQWERFHLLMVRDHK